MSIRVAFLGGPYNGYIHHVPHDPEDSSRPGLIEYKVTDDKGSWFIYDLRRIVSGPWVWYVYVLRGYDPTRGVVARTNPFPFVNVTGIRGVDLL